MNFKLLMILLFISIINLGCSAGNISVKPDKASDPITTDRQLVASPPMDDTYDQAPFYQMQDLVDEAVDNFYYCMNRVPRDTDELMESGFIMAIPKSEYNSKTYYFTENVTHEDPAGIRYLALSDKSYGYEFMVMKSDEMVKYSRVVPEDVWEQRLYSEKSDCADAKVQFLMGLIPRLLRSFYQVHERLPVDGRELFSEYEISEDGWLKTPNGNYNDASFEFGIDQTHNRYYIKYKYTHGTARINSRDAYWLSKEVASMSFEEQEELHLGKKFSFDETPPMDYLVLHKWFDLDSLDEFYSEITN